MKKKIIHPLFFENSKGKHRVIAEVENIKEAHQEINKFCQEHNYTSYYTRMWIEQKATDHDIDGECWQVTFDVGSWSEFFVLFFDTEQQAKEFCNVA